jgi:hypothetical protein
MEELQDAIEDAQYMNAMHDDVPKPTKVCSIYNSVRDESLADVDAKMAAGLFCFTSPIQIIRDVILRCKLNFYHQVLDEHRHLLVPHQ